MTWTKTLTYWVLFAVMAGYYGAVVRRPAPPAAEETRREKVIEAFGDEIERLTLRRGDRAVVSERVEKRWKVVDPGGAQVPADLVAALVELLTEKQEAEVVEGAPTAEDVDHFGLKDPTSTIEVDLKGGRKIAVKLGTRNPPRTAVYAQRSGSPGVLLVGLNAEYYGDLLFEAAFRKP